MRKAKEEALKNLIRLVALSLLFPISAPNAFSGSLDDSKSPESPAVSTSPLLEAPAPMRRSCSLGWNANDDYISTAKNTSVSFSPLWNDDDTPEQNFGGIISDPQHGTAEQIGIDGIRYTPTTGYTGSDSFMYQHIGCSQCFEGWCAEPTYDTATVYITVTN